MKRLQSRLITAFLGVVILTMLPIFFYFYYSIDNWFQSRRDLLIYNEQDEIRSEVDNTTSLIQKAFSPAANEIRNRLTAYPKIADWFRDGESPELFNIIEEDIEKEYAKQGPFFQQFKAGQNIHVISKLEYEQMSPWLEHGRFYQLGNTVNYYFVFKIVHGSNKDNMETVGALLISQPMFEITDSQYAYNIKLRKPYELTHILSPSPFLLKEYLPEEAYIDLYENHVEVNVDSMPVPPDLYEAIYGERITPTEQNDKTVSNQKKVQAWIKPIINQDNNLVGIIMVSERIFNVWEMIGPTILQSTLIVSLLMIVLAVLIARSISKPMYELVDTANQMSQGDFSVRIDVKGTTEQKVLRQTINHLAERITEQFNQLQMQTNKLELSNRELEETQRFLQNILIHIHTGVMSIDREGNINLINQVCRDLLGLGDQQELHINTGLHSPALQKIISHSLSRCVCVYQQEVMYYPQNESDPIPLQVSTVPMMHQGDFNGIVVTIHDLSQLRILEAEVRRHDRLVSLGRMAGGLAHEIRNPLGIIRGSAEILNKRFGDQPGEEGLTEFIVDEVVRLSRVLTDFLMFARPPVPNMEPVSAHDLIATITPYIQQSEKYTIDCHIPDEIPYLYIDIELCKQAFLNLILNAQDAMPEGGIIGLKFRSIRMDEVMIEITDEGSGVPKEIIDRIFDPFVTSKDTGTGLGLSLVHQIISNQNGKIEVESIPNKGTCFRIFLPACQETPAPLDPPLVNTV